MMSRNLLFLVLIFCSLFTYSQCIICPPDKPIDDPDPGGGGGTGGGGTGGGGSSGTFSFQFSGPTNVTYNQSYDYGVTVTGGFPQSVDYYISGGVILFESTFAANVKWTSYGNRWVRVDAVVSGSSYTETVNVTVSGPLTGGSISTSSSNVCYSGNPSNISNSSSATGGDGNHTYSWQKSTNGGSSWSNVGGNGSGLNPPNLTTTTRYRRKVTSDGQTAYSNSVNYTVYSDMNPRTISYSGGNVNPGGSVSMTGAAATGSNGSYNYQWQRKTTGGYSNISGKTGRDLSSVTQNVTTTYRRRVQSCGTKYTNEITVTSNLVPGNISATTGTTICYNANPGNINASLASGANGSYTYQWRYSNNNSTWTNVGSATSSPTALNPPALTANRWYQLKVTSAGQTKYSNKVKYTVYSDVNPQSISYSGGNINPGGSVSMTGAAATGSNGSYSYQWQRKTTGGYSNIPGATSQNLGATNQDVTTTYRRRVISCGRTKYSNEIQVETNLIAGSITASAGTQVYYGQGAGALTSEVATGGSGGYSYEWQESDDNSNWSTLESYLGSPGTYITSGSLTADKWYRMAVWSGSQVEYKTIQVSVYPDLTDVDISSGPSSVVPGGTVSITGSTPTGGDGTYSYQWQSKTTGSYADIPGATDKDLSGVIQDINTTYRRKTVSGQTKYSNEVEVESTLIAGDISGDMVICEDVDFVISSVQEATGGTGTYTYSWENKPVAFGEWVDTGHSIGPSYADLNGISAPTLYRRVVTAGSQTVTSNEVLITPMNLTDGGALTYGGGNVTQGGTPGTITGEELNNDPALEGVTYTWGKRPAITGGSYDPIAGANGANYTPTDPINEPTEYRRMATVCGDIKYATITIDVDFPTLVGGSIQTTDEVICYDCELSVITGDLPSGGSGDYDYQWQLMDQATGEWENIACFTAPHEIQDPNNPCLLDEAATQKDLDVVVEHLGYQPIMTFRRITTSYGQTSISDAVVVLRAAQLDGGNIAYPTSPCQDSPIGLVRGEEATGGMEGYTYTWEQYDGATWNTVASGPDEINYMASGIAAQEYRFRRTVTSADGSSDTSGELVLTPIDCDPSGFNYVRVEVPKTPVSSEQSLTNLPATDKAMSYSYSDGAGRPTVTVAVAAGQNQEDVVAFNHYNPSTGRQDKSYMPFYSSPAIPGMTHTQPESEQAYFYAHASDITHDTAPFSKRSFDDRGRVVQTNSVGAAWQNKYTQFEYKYYVAGTDAPIGKWTITSGLPVNGGLYGNNEVKLRIVTDVEGRISRTAVDPLGRTITSQVYDADADKWFGSYNVYDDYGRVRFVVPAALTSAITASNFLDNLTQQQVDEQIFQYEYDRFGRVIRKKDPGAGWVEIIYDQWDRPVLTRHAAQQLDGADSWTFTKYDAWNRPIYSGQVVTSLSVQQMRDDAADLYTDDGDDTNDLARYEDTADSEVGYTLSNGYPNLGSADFPTYEVLSVSYYDDYSYLTNTDWDEEGEDFSFGMPAGFTATNTTNVLNQVTGGKTRVLGTDTWLNSVVYYDNRLRVIQTVTENHLGGTERLSNEMDWKGELQKMLVQHESTTESVAILTEYEYAHNGQLLKTWQTIDEPGNAGDRVLIAQYNYNVLGQLKEKNLHSTDETSFLQSVDYDYNIKGWVSSINNAGLDDGENDIFGMEFNYTEEVTVGGQTISGRYDGNLTSVVSAATNITPSSVPSGGPQGGQSITAFTYDKRNRLTNTDYATDNAGAWTGNAGDYNMSATYDDSGNMEQVSRKAAGNEIDNIDYSYESGTHRLEKVEELSSSPDKDQGFNDKNDMLTEYGYDAMGNMTSDLNKEIVVINYNHLQLVESIEFGDGTLIDFVYDAGGNRLSKTVTDAGGNELGKVDYAGLIEYNDGKVNQVATAEGRAYKQNKTYHYEYFLADQQGNNRVAFGYLPERNVHTATMETENPEFDWTGVTRATNENHTPTGTYSTALNNAANRTLGPVKVLDIATGDEVEINVWAKYTDDPLGTGTVFGNVVNALLAMTDGAIGDSGVGDALNNTVGSGGTNPFPVDGNTTDNEDAPDSYLAYLFFDASYNFVADKSGFQSVTDQSFEHWSELQTPEKLVFDEPGYLFVYVANESQEDQEVYFDDLRIVHENSTASFKVTQINEYYPYGMQTDKSWRADGYIDPQLMYQSSYASYDSLTGYYDFLFRSYDPALGRFFATDPLAGTTPSYSPYHANFNNPIRFTDPLGLSPRDGRLKDFGGTFNSDAGITANFGQLGYIGAFDAPTAVDYRPSATLRFIASIVGQLMSTSFGGEWTQNGGMSSYASLKEAFGAGVAYNNAHGSWGNTVAGSEGKADFRLNAFTATPLAKKGISGPELANVVGGPNLTPVGGSPNAAGANGSAPPAVSVNLETGEQNSSLTSEDYYNAIDGMVLPNGTILSKDNVLVSLEELPGNARYGGLTGSGKHHVKYDIKSYEETAENIRAVTFHEIYGHGILGASAGFSRGGNHYLAEFETIRSRYWSNTTQDYKSYSVRLAWKLWYNEVGFERMPGDIMKAYDKYK